MSDKAVQFAGVLSIDSSLIKLKKPKGIFLLKKDYNTINILKKSHLLNKETIDLGVSNFQSLKYTYNDKNQLTRISSKPLLNHNRIIKIKEPKKAEKIVLPKLIIYSKSNSSNNTARTTQIESFRGSTRNKRKIGIDV
jgi:hypothetical protein